MLLGHGEDRCTYDTLTGMDSHGIDVLHVTDDDTTVEDSDNTEDSDVDTTTPDSEEDTTSEDEDTSEEEETSNTVTDDTTEEDLSSKSLTELRELCEAKGINAKRFTKTQCLTELTKTPASTD